MRRKVKLKDLPEVLTRLKDVLVRETFLGVRTVFQRNINSELNELSVTGRVFESLRLAGSPGRGFKNVLVGSIGLGEAADLLERGVLSPNYPYNPETGTFLFFDENEGLREWSDIKLPGLSDDAEGVTVGREATTGFGSPKNQWFTNAVSTIGSQKNELVEQLKMGLKKV